MVMVMVTMAEAWMCWQQQLACNGMCVLPLTRLWHLFSMLTMMRMFLQLPGLNGKALRQGMSPQLCKGLPISTYCTGCAQSQNKWKRTWTERVGHKMSRRDRRRTERPVREIRCISAAGQLDGCLQRGQYILIRNTASAPNIHYISASTHKHQTRGRIRCTMAASLAVEVHESGQINLRITVSAKRCSNWNSTREPCPVVQSCGE